MSMFRSELPSAAAAIDFVGLRRVVCTLQGEVEQQRERQGLIASVLHTTTERRDVATIGRARDDYSSLRRLVSSLQQELDTTKAKQAAQQEELKGLEVKTRMLNVRTEETRGKTEELELRLDDLEHEGGEGDEGDDADADASDSTGNAAEADLSVSVAAVRRSLEDGEWVAISGHLWKEKPGSADSSSPALVSKSEVIATLGGPWEEFSCYTDAELAKMGIVRAGSERTVSTPVTGATMDAAELEYTKTKVMAILTEKLQDTSDY
jgi:hypothetical protein